LIILYNIPTAARTKSFVEFYQDVEKVLPWTFSTTEVENTISRFLHFQ